MGMAPSQARSGTDLLSIHCSACGAPATYDIVKHSYACAYCGGTTSITDAQRQHRGFRALRQQTLRRDASSFDAVTCTCTGCGATIVFPKGEVLQSCSFCGRALVRDAYLKIPDFPELIIPFALTPDEAKERLVRWCQRNARRREAAHLRSCLGQMQGYYLPYQLVRGPIDCRVTREGSSRSFACGGFLTSVFVNTSEQLDNLTLNGMEPFDLQGLREFELGYLAQQKAKVDEVDARELDARVRQEVTSSYRRQVQRALETKAVDIEPHTDGLTRMPVLLPVYYVCVGNVCAAVNGQTGKVAVRSERVRKTMPWWIRPIAATLATFAAALAVAARLLGSWEGGLVMAGMFTLVMGLIFYTAYSNAYEGQPRRVLDPKILTSADTVVRAPDGTLRATGAKIAQDPVEPLFFERIDGVRTQVSIRFTTPWRAARAILLGLAVVAAPLLCAFVLNGLRWQGLDLVGSAVWLCIFVPVVPAYLVKMGRIDIYENPLVFTVDERGRRHRVKTEARTATVLDVVRVLFSPPLLPAGLVLLLFFVMSVYLTLGN